MMYFSTANEVLLNLLEDQHLLSGEPMLSAELLLRESCGAVA